MDKDYNFKDAYERMLMACGCTTQTALAGVLEVPQGSISGAICRKSIPERWLLRLVRSRRINPDWILYGDDYPKMLVPTEHSISDASQALDRALAHLG